MDLSQSKASGALPYGLGVVLLIVMPLRAEAGTIGLTFQTDSWEVNVSDTLDVSIVADFTEPLLGFGFELEFDDDLLEQNDFTVGPAFTAVPTGSNDFVSGLAFPLPVSGSNILLGRASFTALRAGRSELEIEIEEGDLTEGFAEVPVGLFAKLDAAEAVVTIASAPGGSGTGESPVPEPATLLLLALGSLGIMTRRHWGR